MIFGPFFDKKSFMKAIRKLFLDNFYLICYTLEK